MESQIRTPADDHSLKRQGDDESDDRDLKRRRGEEKETQDEPTQLPSPPAPALMSVPLERQEDVTAIYSRAADYSAIETFTQVYHCASSVLSDPVLFQSESSISGWSLSVDESSQERYGCPFAKRYGREYAAVFNECTLPPGIEGTEPSMIEHLLQCHQTFSEAHQLLHLNPSHYQMTRQQWSRMDWLKMQRHKTTTLEGWWTRLFYHLFPDASPIPRPQYDFYVKRTPEHYYAETDSQEDERSPDTSSNAHSEHG